VCIYSYFWWLPTYGTVYARACVSHQLLPSTYVPEKSFLCPRPYIYFDPKYFFSSVSQAPAVLFCSVWIDVLQWMGCILLRCDWQPEYHDRYIYAVPALLLLLLCTHLKGFAALIGPAAAKSCLPSKLILFRVVWWHTACVIPLRCRLFHKNISVAVHPHLQWRGGLDERLIVVASYIVWEAQT
jgi:hypothetical protein